MDAQRRRLLGFMTAAVAIHLVFILAVEHTQLDIPARRQLVLSVILEETQLTTARKPNPKPADRGPNNRPSDPETVPANSAPADSATPNESEPAEAGPTPDVYELLRDVPDVAMEAQAPFQLKPESHPIFGKDRAIPPMPSNAFLDESVWHRDGLETEIRYSALDGRQILIKRFDNGEIQICERPHDSLFDHWDDILPFACDRPR